MSLGETISSARSEAGLTVEQVSEQTRIRATVVRAIENDEFALCGGDVYARGHLRSIAKVVGLDADPLVVEYDAAHTASIPTVAEVFESETSTQRPNRGPNWSAVMVAVLVVAAGAVGFQVFRADSDGTRETTTVADPGSSISEQPTQSKSASPSESPTQIAQAETKEVVLTVTALSNSVSWIQVTDRANSVLFDGNVGQGRSKTFRNAKELTLLVGNAAGVELNVNGTDLGAPGKSGEVVSLTFTPKDPDGSAG